MAAPQIIQRLRMQEHKLPPVVACDVDDILRELDDISNKKRNSQGDELNDNQQSRIEKAIASYRWKMKFADIFACLLGFFGIFIATVEYEYYYSDNGKERYTQASFSNIMRAMVSISTAVLVLVMIIRNVMDFYYQKLKNPLLSDTPFYKSTQLTLIIIEFFICGVHMPPGFDYTFEVNQMAKTFIYSLDMIMLNCMYLRVYLLFRGFAAISKWRKTQAEKCCESESCQATTTFAMKAFMKEVPYPAVGFLICSTVVVFGLVIRNFEYPVYYECTSGCQDWSFIWNGMWYCIITMTTGKFFHCKKTFSFIQKIFILVGYGDFFAVTHMGRCMAVIVVFLGVYLSSLIILALTTSSSMEPKEQNAYNIVFRLKAKEDIKKKAATVISHVAKINSLKNKIKSGRTNEGFFKKELANLQNRLTISLEVFTEARTSLQKLDIGPEELLRQLNEKFERDFDDIKKILKSLLQMDKQLTQMEISNHIVFDALVESINYTKELRNQWEMGNQKKIQ